MGKEWCNFQLLHSRIGSWPFSQTLYYGEASRDKHSSLLRRFVNYGRKKFYNLRPRMHLRRRQRRASLLLRQIRHFHLEETRESVQNALKCTRNLFTIIHFLNLWMGKWAGVCYYTRKERFAKDKRSSLLGQFVSYKGITLPWKGLPRAKHSSLLAQFKLRRKWKGPMCYSVTLHNLGRVCQGQTLSLIGPICTLQRNFIMLELSSIFGTIHKFESKWIGQWARVLHYITL